MWLGGSLQENPKRFWSYIKHLWSENFGIPILRQWHSIFISDKDNAEALKDYFQSVFTKDNGLLPAFSPSTLAYINNMRDIVFPQWCSQTTCLIKSIEVSWPRWYLTTLPTWPIRWDFKHFDIHFLTRLWHRHLTKRLVLTAMVVPVHKKLSKENPANYRRISLTCLCSKVMEHIVLSNLNKHLSENNIFVSSAIWLPGQHLKSALRSWCPSVGFLEGFRQSLPY